MDSIVYPQMLPSRSVRLLTISQATARVELPWRTFWEAKPMMASLDHVSRHPTLL